MCPIQLPPGWWIVEVSLLCPPLLLVVWLFVKAFSSGEGEGVGGTEGSCIRVMHTPGLSRSPVLLSPFVLDAKGGSYQGGGLGRPAGIMPLDGQCQALSL